ncbi:MAG: toll/interleukin-1 receptor domain-containing protein, partial [Myxococcales bacterium]|nr:toll/interleukin-1 receptor domain-containing protein [Myxococcales bacterium]
MSSAPPASRPDVHLAYARPDAGLARAVHKYLRKAGIRVTYPDNAAADGQPWLGAADGWLSRARAHVVLLTDRTPPGWQRAEFDASARARAHNASLQTIPVVRDGYEPGDFDEVLDRFDAITLADDGAALEAALAELVERITDPGGLPAMPSHESTHPYPRLRPYGVN